MWRPWRILQEKLDLLDSKYEYAQLFQALEMK